MILKGSQRSNASQLAQHLMNDLDNDHIEIHELRGFVSSDVERAFKEIEAIARGTKCKQYLFSLSLSPPELENVPPEAFDAAIEQIEKKLGLSGQPRAVIFHEKNGRRHAHTVWSRIDVMHMRSINLPHFKMKLQDIAREMYMTHQWDMPDGFKNKDDRDPLNYNAAESQQAKRIKRDPKAIKKIFKDCWAQSDSNASFARALLEHGYVLAKGDRRGFVAVDGKGEIYSVSRWAGVKTKDVRARLGVRDGLPSVDEALKQFEGQSFEAFEEPRHQENDQYSDAVLAFTAKRLALVKKHRSERDWLQKQYLEKIALLRAETSQQPTKGLKAIWLHVTGGDKKQQKAVRAKLVVAKAQQAHEKQVLIQNQLVERRQLQQSYRQLQHHHDMAVRHLWRQVGASLSVDEQRTKSRGFECFIDPTQLLLIDEENDRLTAQQVRRNPAHILDVITNTKEHFSRNDIVRGLARYIEDPTQLFLAIEKTMRSEELVDCGDAVSKRFTTKSLCTVKTQLQNDASAMVDTHHAVVKQSYIDSAIKAQSRKIQLTAGAELSPEQDSAIRHVLKANQLNVVTGFAGAGKSTMLEAANKAWKHQGLNVIGAALSGKAADGLENSSGIKSRTIASLEKSWENGYSLLSNNDVLVIDEAGMVGLRQMARLMAEVKKRGAKLVLVGDAEQLQPIQAGTPFKEIEDQIGAVKLTEIRRQKQAWQRTASVQLAGKQTRKAIETYHAHGCVKTTTESTEAIASLIADYMDDVTARGVDASRVALAHRRKDVHLINQSIRAAYVEAGLLGETLTVQTNHGPRKFSIGDQIVCTQNDRDINVRNGMLGMVTNINSDTGELKIALDGDDGGLRTITINPKLYSAIEHGYATTTHKSQGATVDKSFILGSKTMDRHLTYVAMTRHREDTTLYLGNAAQERLLGKMHRRLRQAHYVEQNFDRY